MLLLLLWTYTGPLVTPTPACRTCVIAAENRTHVVRC